MIDIKEFKEIIKLQELKTVNTSLYLFEDKKTKNNPITIYLLNIEEDIIKRMRTAGINYLNEINNMLNTDDLADFPLYNPDSSQELFKIESIEIENFPNILEYITGERPCSIYNKEDIKEDKIKSWIIRFELILNDRTEQLLFFQKFQPSKMLSQKFFTIFEKNKTFKMLEGNILNINYSMDFFYYKNTFIVSKMSAFERTFGFHEYYKNAAIALVGELTTQKVTGSDCKIVFKNTDDVNLKIDSSTRLAYKLFSAKRNNYYKKINYSKLVKLNEKYKFDLNLDDNKKEWLVDEKSDLKVVARVLNDDYEVSQITDIEYIVDSKEMAK